MDDLVAHPYNIAMLMLSHTDELQSYLYDITLVYLYHMDESGSRPYQIELPSNLWYKSNLSWQ